MAIVGYAGATGEDAAWGAGVDSGGILDPGGALEHLAAWKGRIDKLAADTQAMSARMQELRVTASDGDGLAEVTLDSSGGLVDVRLSARIGRATPEKVSAAIMEAAGRAKAQLAERSREIITDTLGTGAAARGIAERVERGLLPPDPDEGGGRSGGPGTSRGR